VADIAEHEIKRRLENMLLDAGATVTELAESIGVSARFLGSLLRGKLALDYYANQEAAGKVLEYLHLEPEPVVLYQGSSETITAEQLRERLKTLHAATASQRTLADTIGISQTHLSNILAGKEKVSVGAEGVLAYFHLKRIVLYRERRCPLPASSALRSSG
jgi:DNA-binding Xre family transcriptional regulator